MRAPHGAARRRRAGAGGGTPTASAVAAMAREQLRHEAPAGGGVRPVSVSRSHHRGAFAGEHPDVALGLCQTQRRVPATPGLAPAARQHARARACSTSTSMTTPVRPPASAAASSRSSRAVASARDAVRPGRRVVGEENPGQGDVLVLAQRRTARRRRTGLGRVPTPAHRPPHRRRRAPWPGRRLPAARSGRSRRRRPARPPRAGRPPSPRRPRPARSRAIATRHRYGFCGRPADSPSSSACAQVLGRAGEVAAFPGHPAQPDVHVGRTPRRRGVVCGQVEGVLDRSAARPRACPGSSRCRRG